MTPFSILTLFLFIVCAGGNYSGTQSRSYSFDQKDTPPGIVRRITPSPGVEIIQSEDDFYCIVSPYFGVDPQIIINMVVPRVYSMGPELEGLREEWARKLGTPRDILIMPNAEDISYRINPHPFPVVIVRGEVRTLSGEFLSYYKDLPAIPTREKRPVWVRP